MSKFMEWLQSTAIEVVGQTYIPARAPRNAGEL